MSSKWKTAACVAGIVGLVAVAGAVHMHMALRWHMGSRPGGQAMSMADKTGITATGYAEVKPGAQTQPTAVQVQLSEQATADELDAKVAEFQTKLDKLKADFAAAGISADAVQVQNFNISTVRDMPMKGLDYAFGAYDPTIDRPDTKDYVIGASLMVTVSSMDQSVKVAKAAVAAGANTFDTNAKYGPRRTYFDTAALEPAVKQATEQAKALAAAQAAASGVRLGALRQISVQQPDYYGGPYDSYRVTVSVTYDIATAQK